MNTIERVKTSDILTLHAISLRLVNVASMSELTLQDNIILCDSMYTLTTLLLLVVMGTDSLKDYVYCQVPCPSLHYMHTVWSHVEYVREFVSL